MSEFWKYFRDTLAWPLIHTPGPLSAVVQGAALALDRVRDDVVYFRRQWFPALCTPELVADHGQSRGLVRHSKEAPDQFRARVVNAYRWHMLGGITEGLPEILKFYGFKALRIENMREFSPARWAEFQVGFGTPASTVEQQEILDNLHALVWLINEYKPARSFFYRMYNDVFDKRPIVLSVGPKLGDGWLSFFSGVPVEGVGDQDKDTIVSFGVRYAGQADAYITDPLYGSFGSIIHYGFLVPYLDRFMVGRSQLSDVYPRNHGFAMSSLFSILWADRATTGRRWRGEWDARRWLDYTGFDRKLPPWRMERRAASRAQLLLSEVDDGANARLGDINARLGATFATLIDAPMRLGSARLSAHDSQRRCLRLHEMFVDTQGHVTPPVNPGVPHAAGASRLSVASPLSDPHRVQHVRHDELAAHMQQREALPLQEAAHLHRAAQSNSVAPCAAPPSAFINYRAPQWLGAWTEPGRTWRTEKELSRR